MKKETKKKISEAAKTVLMFVLNPRLLLCFGIAWIITNGWSYIALGLGILFDIELLSLVAGSYLALMWVPGTPEKIITLAIGIFLLRILFPKDEKTLGILRSLRQKAVSAVKRRKNKKSKKDEENE